MQSSKLLFDDEDDITALMDTKISSKSKKSSLMDEIFPKSRDSLLTKNPSFKVDSPGNPTSNNETSKTDLPAKSSNSSNYSFNLPESRQRRRPANVPLDPLGFLSTSNTTLQNDSANSKNKPIDDDLPAWLNGSSHAKELPIVDKSIEQSNNPAILPAAKENVKNVSSTTPVTTKAEESNNEITKFLSTEIDQQAIIMNLQQQEHELRTAASLARQSDKLSHLLEAQKMRLNEQEKQFNVLISKQLERQSLLEAQLKSQSDRIDNYIQALAAQPITLSTGVLSRSLNDLTANCETSANSEQYKLENQVQKLDLEKSYLENAMESLKDKHEKELTLLEESYKKQITILEESLVQMEKRMQDEIEYLEADYKSKIKKIKDEMNEKDTTHKEEKQALMGEHLKIIEEIRQRHSKSFDFIQEEHNTFIENITKSKDSERHALKIMKSEGTNVENLLNKSETIMENLEGIQKKIVEQTNVTSEMYKHHLELQEKHIGDLKEALEKQRSDSGDEKQKFIHTVEQMQNNISKLTAELVEQNSTLKERENILKAEESALMKERQIFIEQTKWEREKFQAMVETWAKEHERQLEFTSQERQCLATERGKLEVFNRLKISFEDSTKAELEATIRAAQEAITNANQERLKWQEKLHELDLEKNSLLEKEQSLVQRAKELQEFTQSALAKREEGFEALRKAHLIEEKCKEKFERLKIQQQILTQRESRLAAEKLDLASERLSFRIGEMDKPERDFTRPESIKDDQSISETRSITQISYRV